MKLIVWFASNLLFTVGLVFGQTTPDSLSRFESLINQKTDITIEKMTPPTYHLSPQDYHEPSADFSGPTDILPTYSSNFLPKSLINISLIGTYPFGGLQSFHLMYPGDLIYMQLNQFSFGRVNPTDKKFHFGGDILFKNSTLNTNISSPDYLIEFGSNGVFHTFSSDSDDLTQNLLAKLLKVNSHGQISSNSLLQSNWNWKVRGTHLQFMDPDRKGNRFWYQFTGLGQGTYQTEWFDLQFETNGFYQSPISNLKEDLFIQDQQWLSGHIGLLFTGDKNSLSFLGGGYYINQQMIEPFSGIQFEWHGDYLHWTMNYQSLGYKSFLEKPLVNSYWMLFRYPHQLLLKNQHHVQTTLEWFPTSDGLIRQDVTFFYRDNRPIIIADSLRQSVYWDIFSFKNSWRYQIRAEYYWDTIKLIGVSYQVSGNGSDAFEPFYPMQTIDFYLKWKPNHELWEIKQSVVSEMDLFTDLKKTQKILNNVAIFTEIQWEFHQGWRFLLETTIYMMEPVETVFGYYDPFTIKSGLSVQF